MEMNKIKTWGKDHWSLIAYIEYRGINYKGVLDKKHLRLKNPMLVNSTPSPFIAPEWNPAWGTRMRGYYLPNGDRDESKILPDHDDLDCIEDMEAEGVVENTGTGFNPVCKLTPKGMKFASALSKHKQDGMSFAAFGEAIEATLRELDIDN